MFSQVPLYNLMFVLKETGLKADVLRVWERRYDLPHPHRTAGRHRLYSDLDIATVKWLKDRQAEGLSISRAVQLWKDTLNTGFNPLETAVHAEPSATPARTPGNSIEILRQQWLAGCLDYDAIRAEEALDQAFALYPVEIACSAILQQGLKTIGEQWYLGKVSVQQEHFASALAICRLETLLNAVPQPTRNQTVLIGCPAGELHTFPALLLSLLLKRTGLKVIYLGADIPLEQMDVTVETIHPALVVMAAQQLTTAASLAEAALVLRERGIPLAYGGLIFNLVPELRERIPATFLEESLEKAVGKINQLFLSHNTNPPSNVENEFPELAKIFWHSRSSIEHLLNTALESEGQQIENIEAVNHFFGTRLIAALELGNPAFMESELDWIDGLLTNHPIPLSQLLNYLTIYGQCVHSVLGEKGMPITHWIDKYVSHHKLS